MGQEALPWFSSPLQALLFPTTDQKYFQSCLSSVATPTVTMAASSSARNPPHAPPNSPEMIAVLDPTTPVMDPTTTPPTPVRPASPSPSETNASFGYSLRRQNRRSGVAAALRRLDPRPWVRRQVRRLGAALETDMRFCRPCGRARRIIDCEILFSNQARRALVCGTCFRGGEDERTAYPVPEPEPDSERASLLPQINRGAYWARQWSGLVEQMEMTDEEAAAAAAAAEADATRSSPSGPTGSRS